MSKPTRRPDNAAEVKTYGDLDKWIRMFAGGHLNLLVLVGGAGLQKTRAVREAVGQDAAWIEGNISPLGLYRALYDNRDKDVVIDDVDELYRHPNCKRLLKQVCGQERTKTISWASTQRALEGLPPRFNTSSRVLIITNEWKTLDGHVRAIEDRGVVVLFEPDAREVHLRTASWFFDQEIFDYIGERLNLVTRPTMRIYETAWRIKSSGEEGSWQRWLLETMLRGNVKAQLVAELLADPKFKTEAERVQEFTRRGGGCKATYYNEKKGLKPQGETPKITLQNQPPSDEVAQVTTGSGEGVIEAILARHRIIGRG